MTSIATDAGRGSQRADLLRRIAWLRWAAVALSFALIPITRPVPISPAALYALTVVVAAVNAVVFFAGGLRERRSGTLAVLTLVTDMVFCTTWVGLCANDPNASNYVMFMVVSVEAAVLFYWRGVAAFAAAFVPAFLAVYVVKWAAYHEPLVLGSMIFRFAIVILMACMSGSIASASERSRAAAEAAALEARRESSRLQMVHGLARGLGSSLRRDEVLQAVVEALRELFPQRWSGVILNDRPGLARLVAANGDPSSLELRMPPEDRLWPVDQSLRLANFWESMELDSMGIVPPESLRAYTTAAVVPLHVGGRRLGALVALGREGDQFDEDDVRLLEAVAPQVSTALDNARLYEETESLSLTDALTGLGNRRAFEQRLQEEIERSNRHKHPLALVILDIDHFKVYNDTHGHQAGDDILRRLGTALVARLLRTTDMIFRHGGEEFAVILPETTALQAEAVMRRVHEMLAHEPLPLGDHQPGGHLTISAGVSSSAGESCVAGALVEQADLALFGAKQSGRNRTVVYNSDLAASLTNWTAVLPGILDTHSMHAVYQPIVRLSDRRVVAYEALARPDRDPSVAGVDGMFTAAQRMGRLHDLDWLCFRVAAEGARALEPGCELFINITLSALLDASRDPEYMEMVLRAVGRPAPEVVFEISEREAVTDMPRLRGIMRAYRKLGLRFAIDDVGEGHSTFELLAAAEPEYVKIARSLVVDADGTGSVGTIRALVEFGRATGARVVAEGIADEDLARRMAQLGVELGQGYALGRPGPLAYKGATTAAAAG